MGSCPLDECPTEARLFDFFRRDAMTGDMVNLVLPPDELIPDTFDSPA